MRTYHDALYHLGEAPDGSLREQFGRDFDVVAYSRFKYGYTPPASLYARGLFALLIERYREIVIDDRPLAIISAPYVWIPTASHAIATWLATSLSQYRVAQRRSPVLLVQLRKSAMGSDTYAMASLADRRQMLAALTLELDHGAVHAANVIVIDDIRVTGTAEAVTAAALEPHQPHSVIYLHAASLDPQLGFVRSQLEDELNQSFRTTRRSVLRDIVAGQFELNTRVNRMLLTVTDEADEADLVAFLASCPLELIAQMRDGVLGGGHEYVNRLRVGLAALEVTLDHHFLPAKI